MGDTLCRNTLWSPLLRARSAARVLDECNIAIVDTDCLCAVVGLVDSDQARSQLEHVVSKRNDDELRLLCAVLDVIGDDGDIPEV